MKLWQKNLIIMLVVALIAVIPLFILKDAEFAGADGLAEEAILETVPGYEPWFSPLIEPASGEIESLLFCLQAALGAGVMGFALGRITAKKADKDK